MIGGGGWRAVDGWAIVGCGWFVVGGGWFGCTWWVVDDGLWVVW